MLKFKFKLRSGCDPDDDAALTPLLPSLLFKSQYDSGVNMFVKSKNEKNNNYICIIRLKLWYIPIFSKKFLIKYL